MKTNKALEKIYVDANEGWLRTFIAFTDKAKGNDIEYIRTDAFIEKACDWLEKHTFSELNLDFGHFLEIMEFVNRFKEYMKGE